MKERFKLFLHFTLLFVACQQGNAYEGDNSHNFPNNDFFNFFKDLQKKTGLDEKAFSEFGRYFTKLVQEGQAYTARDFERDVNNVKENPTFWNIIDFIKKTTWPGFVNGFVRVINFFSQIQQFILKFLERKCDKHIGKYSVFHPWNILREQDKTNISFLVFVYVLALSLILIKLLSWWNFMVYLSFSFLLYYLGGPYLIFKWLLTLTGFFWFIFDVVIHNPLQVAVVIIVLYLLNLAKHFISSDQSSTHVVPSRERSRSSSTRLPDEERRSISNGPDREEFTSLVERIEGMEMKTNMLYSKLDKLSRSIERLVPVEE